VVPIGKPGRNLPKGGRRAKNALYEAQSGELLLSPQLLRVDEEHFGGGTYRGCEFGTHYRL
jgi:hypothetical protein